MRVLWNGALDRQRQMEARRGVRDRDQCTFSLIGEGGTQGSALRQAMDRAVSPSTDTGSPGRQPASE
ncbi:MAG: hypothetical protein AB7P99_16465 [Vicinamibacterales bacterium]